MFKLFGHSVTASHTAATVSAGHLPVQGSFLGIECLFGRRAPTVEGGGSGLNWMKMIVKTFGLDWNDVSHELHLWKKSEGMGGADNLDRKGFMEFLKQIFGVGSNSQGRF